LVAVIEQIKIEAVRRRGKGLEEFSLPSDPLRGPAFAREPTSVRLLFMKTWPDIYAAPHNGAL
jgi:hypothetical protein